MILVEKHIINNQHPFFNECDNLCFLSKNLYNVALYNVRQFYFENKKYLDYVKNFHQTKTSVDYKALPAKVANQTIKLVDKNFKSFFSLLKNGYTTAKIPKYLDKLEGRFITRYEKQSLSLGEFKKTGLLHLSKTNIKIQTKVKDFKSIKEVRIIPRNEYYCIEVVYEFKEVELKTEGVYSAIDLGLNNLATITFSDGSQPLIINGKPLKSINQFYNKQKSIIQSELEKINKKKKSKRLIRLTNKRNNKVNDYLHKSSFELVNQLVSRGVKCLVIGKNTNMKQDINLGKVNNQNFTCLPIFKFANMIEYKCKKVGIKVIFQEESYTSKCSFLDLEEIKKQEIYLGKRIKRGLFVSSKGKVINADVNGSYNILRKAIPNVFVTEGIEVLAVKPLRVKSIKG